MFKKNTVYFEVWGDFAIFTRPEFKVERYSYDVPTPSSIRNLCQAVYWHPQFQYEIKKITVFNRITRMNITRNELEKMISAPSVNRAIHDVQDNGCAKSISVLPDDVRQQRASSFLTNVHYGIEAEIKPSRFCAPDFVFDFNKILAIFNRRMDKGQCFNQPYLGMKECRAHFSRSRYNTPSRSFYEGTTLDLGRMFFDSDYRNPTMAQPHFYDPVMVDGIIHVNSQQEVLGDAAFCIS